MKTRNGGVQKAENLLNRSRMHDGGRMDDKGEGGAATFDGKKAKIKGDIVGWRVEGPRQNRDKGTYEKSPGRGYIQ